MSVLASLVKKSVFDGGHKLDRFITDTLGRYVEYVPVCPEFECGLGVPREAMRLVGDPSNPRLVTTHTRVDDTERMVAWARTRVKELEHEELCGFIFKSNSPSSGVERVRVYDEHGVPSKRGVGIFARIFMQTFPRMPVEEDGRLHDMKIRENFIERIFTLKRLRDTLAAGKRRGNLVVFHTRHKLLILSHSPKHLVMMGNLVAHAKGMSSDELFSRYETMLMDAMALKATPSKHVNVLHHAMGYFKEHLSSDEKKRTARGSRRIS